MSIEATFSGVESSIDRAGRAPRWLQVLVRISPNGNVMKDRRKNRAPIEDAPKKNPNSENHLPTSVTFLMFKNSIPWSDRNSMNSTS